MTKGRGRNDEAGRDDRMADSPPAVLEVMSEAAWESAYPAEMGRWSVLPGEELSGFICDDY